MVEVVYKWPPLESDPVIFNKYFRESGLPEFIGFEELFTLNNEENMFDQYSDFPIFGVLAAVNLKKRYYYKEDLLPWDSIPFYMKQTKELDLACGLIGALNIFGNNLEIFELPQESLLKSFFDKCSICNAEERAKLLEESKDFKQKHNIYSHQGQSNLPTEESESEDEGNNSQETKKVIKNQVYHHFISFIEKDGNLIELDGTLPSPLLIKKEINGKLLSETIQEIKKRMELGYIGEDLSILFLTYN